MLQFDGEIGILRKEDALLIIAEGHPTMKGASTSSDRGSPPQKPAPVLNQLEQERTRLTSQLEGLNTAISALNGTGNKRTAAVRARMAAGQHARWAKVKGRKVVSITARKRTMSPAARRRIVAAQKARWAKWRKAQKKT